MKRMVIYNKDVQKLIGKGKTGTHNLLSKLRQELNKPKFKPVTVREFCDYMGLDYEVVLKALD